MTDLLRLVEVPACSWLPYIDPAFPDRPLVLHAARPRDYDLGTPVLFVHHGVGRNGRDYRDYWLNLVDQACILAISIEFPEADGQDYRRLARQIRDLARQTRLTVARTELIRIATNYTRRGDYLDRRPRHG